MHSIVYILHPLLNGCTNKKIKNNKYINNAPFSDACLFLQGYMNNWFHNSNAKTEGDGIIVYIDRLKHGKRKYPEDTELKVYGLWR